MSGEAVQSTLDLDFDFNAAVAVLSPEGRDRMHRLLKETQDIEARDQQRKDHILANLRWPKTKSALLDEVNRGKLGHYSESALNQLLAELEISGDVLIRHKHVIRRGV
jgi:hypothetical protein